MGSLALQLIRGIIRAVMIRSRRLVSVLVA